MTLLLPLPPAASGADFPEFSAGIGMGYGGLPHQEYLAGAPRSAEVGHFSAEAWWGDVVWALPSRFSIGLRAHLLRVPLEKGCRLGTVDLFPAVLQLGYHHPGLEQRLQGFVGLGAGFAWARLQSPADTSVWRSAQGGEVGLTRERPFVFEATVGADFEVVPNLMLEASLVSVLMDTEVSYRLVPSGEPESTFEPEYGYTVKGRHLLLTVGLRWWFEWW